MEGERKREGAEKGEGEGEGEKERGGGERPGALSFKLGPGSHYLPNQHSHNVEQQTNSGLLRTLCARRERGREKGGKGRSEVLSANEEGVC